MGDAASDCIGIDNSATLYLKKISNSAFAAAYTARKAYARFAQQRRSHGLEVQAYQGEQALGAHDVGEQTG